MSIASELEKTLRSKGASLVGFADLRKLTPDVRKHFPYGISIAARLNPQIVARIIEGPTREYNDEYERLNALLDSLGHLAEEFLLARGYRAHCAPATNTTMDSAVFDPVSLTTPLPHKTVATRAGLGWIGKCALLVTREFGPTVRLTSVLTDAELPAGDPIDVSYCGNCTACVDICPTHAPSGENWQVGKYRDSFFNAPACRTNARKMTLERLGEQKSICGMCIAACPWTGKYIDRESNVKN